MAKYSYNELRSAAAAGKRIGGWKGYDVYACSKYDYDATSSHFWVLYDDDNKLVRKGYCSGSIDERGNIYEMDSYKYKVSKRPIKKEEKSIPATQYSAFMAGATANDVAVDVNVDDFFLRIDREINELLEQSRNMDLSFKV